jgi:antitoxin component YwqK of YwqJK toxin-antitoxin module
MSVSRYEGLDELRRRCPPGSRLTGPESDDGTIVTINGRVTAACLRPDGTYHGPSITWYESGSKESEGEYRDGAKSGMWRYWHDNGQLAGTGAFVDGKPDGAWQHFDRSGGLVGTTHYRNGIEAREP